MKIPPQRRFHFSILFIIREAEVFTSFYQATAIGQLDTLMFDTIIKLRNNKKQSNENSIHILISKDCKSLSKKTIRGKILTLTKESNVIKWPSAGKNSENIRDPKRKIERAHCAGGKKRSTCRKIEAKLSGFKTKERILAEANKGNPKEFKFMKIFRATVEIREKKLRKGKRAKSPK